LLNSPLIDRVYRLMHLWRAGEVIKVDEYIDQHGLRRHGCSVSEISGILESTRPPPRGP
jgi:hypothetical protein